MLDSLSGNSVKIVQCLSCTTEHVSHQANLVQKRGESLTPLNTRISTITHVGSRNVRAGSLWVSIAWYCDSAILGLTRTTSRDTVLRKAEGNAPEVVRQVEVIMLGTELRVRRIRSNTSTPETSA